VHVVRRPVILPLQKWLGSTQASQLKLTRLQRVEMIVADLYIVVEVKQTGKKYEKLQQLSICKILVSEQPLR
jgi:hypothetical protein